MKEKRRLVLCDYRRTFELICRKNGWSPSEAVYCSNVERMAGFSPESVVVVYGHRYWTTPESVQDRAEMLWKLGAEKIHVET